MEKGIFEKRIENLIIEGLCSKLKFKNKFLNLVKRPVISIFVKYGDNSFIEKMPEEYKVELRRIVSLIYDKNYNQARMFITDFLNKKINIKNLDDADELDFFNYGTKMLVLSLKIFLNKDFTADY